MLRDELLAVLRSQDGSFGTAVRNALQVLGGERNDRERKNSLLRYQPKLLAALGTARRALYECRIFA